MYWLARRAIGMLRWGKSYKGRRVLPEEFVAPRRTRFDVLLWALSVSTRDLETAIADSGGHLFVVPMGFGPDNKMVEATELASDEPKGQALDAMEVDA